MASEGRIKSGFCGSNMSSLSELYGIEGDTGNFKEVGPPADDGFAWRVSVLGEGDVVGAIFGGLHGGVARGGAKGADDTCPCQGRGAPGPHHRQGH